MVIEHRDLAVMPPPGNFSLKVQKQWLAVQQSQVNQDTLKTILTSSVDLLTGVPIVALFLVYVAVAQAERKGYLSKPDAIALRALVTVANAGSILGSLAGGIGAIKGVFKG